MQRYGKTYKTALALEIVLAGLILASAGEAKLADGRSFRGTAQIVGAFGFEVPHVAHIQSGRLYLFTPNLNPGNDVVYNESVAGLSYLGPTTGWGLINEQQVPMTVGADFNFLDATGIGQVATGYFPAVPLGVGNFLIPFVSPVFDSGLVDRWPAAVQWTGAEWQAVTAEPLLTRSKGIVLPVVYNVLPVVAFDPRLSVVTADANTTSGFADSVLIDHAMANGRPTANLLVVQMLETTDTWADVVPAPLGVWYNVVDHRWRVFREDRAAMPLGATFAVLVSDTLQWDDFENGNLCSWSSTVPSGPPCF